jgi:hypothetical protein
VTAHYIASSGLYGWHKAGKFQELREKFRKELATIVRLRQNRQPARILYLMGKSIPVKRFEFFL